MVRLVLSVTSLIYISSQATVGYQSAYATDIVAVQRVYYNQIYNFSCKFLEPCFCSTADALYVDQWFIVMSTQLIGFSIGGVARRFLVAPPSMIWPLSLVNCALFNTLHSTQYAGIGSRGGLSRERFFLYAFIGSFTWCKPPSALLPLMLTFDQCRFLPGLHMWVSSYVRRDISFDNFGYSPSPLLLLLGNLDST